MGSLLSIVAEENLFKLTKSICTCQGKFPLPRKSIPRKFRLKIPAAESILDGRV
jgi:hypothetical protein